MMKNLIEKTKERYPIRKTLGLSSLEPYRIVGRIIKNKIEEAGLSILEIALETKWNWQTVRRITVGTRRTDFVEFVNIAMILAKDKEDFKRIILECSEEIFNFIQKDIPSKWK